MLQNRITTRRGGQIHAGKSLFSEGFLSPLLWALLLDDLLVILSMYEIDLPANVDVLVVVVKEESEELISKSL